MGSAAGPLPHHADRLSFRQQQGGVQGAGPEQLQADGPDDACHGGCQPVEGRQSVQPFQKHATPLVGYRTRAQQFVQGDALDLRQAAQTVGGEAVAAGGWRKFPGVGNRVHQPFPFQPFNGLVDGAP